MASALTWNHATDSRLRGSGKIPKRVIAIDFARVRGDSAWHAIIDSLFFTRMSKTRRVAHRVHFLYEWNEIKTWQRVRKCFVKNTNYEWKSIGASNFLFFFFFFFFFANICIKIMYYQNLFSQIYKSNVHNSNIFLYICIYYNIYFIFIYIYYNIFYLL